MKSPKDVPRQDGSPIDVQEALERMGGDEALLEELLDLYVEDFRQRFSDLRQAVQAGDFSRIRETGHALKGSSANLSLGGLREAAQAMEAAGKESDLEGARLTLPVIEKEFQRLMDYQKKKAGR